MPKADHIFVQSEQMKRDVAAEGIPEGKLTPVPMAVSLEGICSQQTEPGTRFSKDGKVVLYLGTLGKARRMDFLLRVFVQVLHLVPNAKLYIVGDSNDPDDKKALEVEALRLGISHAVVFTGFVPREEAWRYLSAADVCVSPFYPIPILNSTSPTKLIEYMAMSKPVVANDHPEQQLVISESRGGICVPYKENAFADAIVHLLSHPEEAREIGRKGKHYVVRHRTYKIIADVVENEYLRICRTRAPKEKP
jgi:glycosyltransferase involved in cell wall biosynthesis